MSAPQFTPGPWQSKGDYTVAEATTIIANVDGESFTDGTTSHSYDFIATCEDEYGEMLPNAQANARLIRQAPTMYERLALLVRVLSDLPTTQANDELWGAYTGAVAALLEAGGEQ